MFSFRHALGVDIGDDACRIVGLRAIGAGREITFAAYLPFQDEGSIGDAEAALAATLAGVAGGRLAGALPASGCVFKTACLPPGKPAELAQVIKFEAENQFPLPLNELVWGYALSPEPSGRRHAVIAGARRSLVDERLELLRTAGAMPVALLPAPVAAARAIRAPDGLHVLVLADAKWSDLCLYDGGRLLGCRSVLAGAPDSEGWTERIAREIHPWLAGNESPREIVLLGLALPATADALSRATGLPAAVGNPAERLLDPRGCLHEPDDPLAAYATAIGLAHAILDRRPVLNLLPRHIVEARAAGKKQAAMLIVLLLAAIALLPPTLAGHRHLQERQAMLLQVQVQVREAHRAAGKALAPGMIPASQVIRTLEQPESQPLDVLALISAEVPDGITLTDLTYERGKVVLLKGRATSNTALTTAVAAVNRLPVFERALLDHATLVKEKGEQGYDFQITCTLPAGADPTLGTEKSQGAAQPQKGMVIR